MKKETKQRKEKIKESGGPAGCFTFFFLQARRPRAGELLVRRQMPEELFETIIFMDLSPIENEEEKRLQKEDNIIETALSFVDDYYLKNIPVRILFMEDTLREMLVDAGTGFEPFYDKCSDLSFSSPYPLNQILESVPASPGCGSCILITASVTDDLVRSVSEKQQAGTEALLINVGELAL